MITVMLPWPDTDLWPNRRPHPIAKARLVKQARSDAYYLTRLELERQAWYAVDDAPIPITVTGHKPNDRKRDATNLQAALKAALDGVADALNVDDERFRVTTDWGPVDPPRGKVVVEVGK